ncbi:MAG: Crp/Fnr family transcriptional regulator [Afipia sp.]|jgi:CRP-like cAMP-binding protein|nr:Crp/Fnr family transcriptional regulator [Afipia sp.]
MAHHSDLNILGRTELFRDVTPATLIEIQSAGFRTKLASGEVLFQQGDSASSLFSVIAGRLRATQTTPDGQQIIIRYLAPGETAGHATLARGVVHPSTVTAVDDSHLVGWSSETIWKIMEQHPAVTMNALAVLSARYHEIQLRLLELSTEKVERRIGHTVLRLANQAGRRTARGIEIAFPLSRQDLAEMAGTTLHTVSRILSRWEDLGIVDCGRRQVVVCKPNMLETISDEPS